MEMALKNIPGADQITEIVIDALIDTNEKVYKKEITKNNATRENAIKTTPGYKAMAALGFTEIVDIVTSDEDFEFTLRKNESITEDKKSQMH